LAVSTVIKMCIFTSLKIRNVQIFEHQSVKRPKNDIIHWTRSSERVRGMHRTGQKSPPGPNITHRNLSQSAEPFYLYAKPKAIYTQSLKQLTRYLQINLVLLVR